MTNLAAEANASTGQVKVKVPVPAGFGTVVPFSRLYAKARRWVGAAELVIAGAPAMAIL